MVLNTDERSVADVALYMQQDGEKMVSGYTMEMWDSSMFAIKSGYLESTFRTGACRC